MSTIRKFRPVWGVVINESSIKSIRARLTSRLFAMIIESTGFKLSDVVTYDVDKGWTGSTAKLTVTGYRWFVFDELMNQDRRSGETETLEAAKSAVVATLPKLQSSLAPWVAGEPEPPDA